MDQSLNQPDLLINSPIDTTLAQISRLVGSPSFILDPRFDQLYQKHFKTPIDQIRPKGFRPVPKESAIDILDLGAEFTSWAVIMTQNADTMAQVLLPPDQKKNAELTRFFADKLKSRAIGLLQRFVELSSQATDGVQDVYLLRLMQKGLWSHKSLITSLVYEHEWGEVIPLGEALSFYFGKEERVKGLSRQDTKVFTDSMWELFEYLHIQREDSGQADIAAAIDEFNNKSQVELKEGAATTDSEKELERMRKYLDFFIVKGLLPKPDPNKPPEITIFDYGPGFDRILKLRVKYLTDLGYTVKINAVDVSQEVADFQRGDKVPKVNFYQILFSETPFEPGLLGSGDAAFCDWGSIQHAWQLSEMISSLQAMVLNLKEGKPIFLNVTHDSGKVEQIQLTSIQQALNHMDLFYKPGTIYFSYPGQEEGTYIYIPPRELWIKLVQDVGISLINLDPVTFKGVETTLPSPVYEAGDRKRMDLIGTAGSVLDTDNIISLRLALERFGAIAFPQMVKDESKNA